MEDKRLREYLSESSRQSFAAEGIKFSKEQWEEMQSIAEESNPNLSKRPTGTNNDWIESLHEAYRTRGKGHL